MDSGQVLLQLIQHAHELLYLLRRLRAACLLGRELALSGLWLNLRLLLLLMVRLLLRGLLWNRLLQEIVVLLLLHVHRSTCKLIYLLN
jgi:hypothetical protein